MTEDDRAWPACLDNGTEMGRRIAAFPWGQTTLGPIGDWPLSLRLAVGIVIDSAFPMYIFWGADAIALYNDAYVPIAGRKHPDLLGRPSREGWSEIWDQVEGLLASVRAGDPVIATDLPLLIQRHGYPEEAFFTFSYSVMRDGDGRTVAVLATVVETTANVVAKRRVDRLRDIGLRTIAVTDESTLYRRIAESMSNSPDVPRGRVSIAPVSASATALAFEIGDAAVPFDGVATGEERGGTVAFAIPSRDGRAIGTLTVALNPKLPFDDAYREFLVMLTTQLGGSIGAARDLAGERMRAESLRITRTLSQIGLFEQWGQQLFWVTNPDGWIDWYHQSWYDYTGQTFEDAQGWGWRDVHHADDLAGVTERWTACLRTGTPFEMTFRLRGKDGRFRWFLTRAVPEFNAHGDVLRWYGTNTNIDAQRHAAQQLDVLAELGEQLVRTLDRRATLAAVVDALLRELADWVMINLAGQNGRLILAAARHRDPEKSPLLEPFVGTFYDRPGGRSGAARVFASGRPELHETTSPAVALGQVSDPFQDVVERLGLTSVVIVPIVSKGETVGTFHVLSSGDKRYAERDLPFFLEIGRRIGYALAYAEAYTREALIARTFQSAALPHSLPSVPGLSFSSMYEPAGSEANVGGDFYDAFRLLDGRVVISIGDVAGSGTGAAATMAALRQSIRAAAMISPDPALALKAGDGVFADGDGAAFASAFVAVIDPLSFSMQYANAGHPPPLLRLPGGDVRTLEGSDFLLGIEEHRFYGNRRVHKLELEPGSLLVLYTDGITEATRDLAEGERRLLAAVRDLDGSTAVSAGAASTIRASVVGDAAPHDDTAVLTVALVEPLRALDGVRTWLFDAGDAAAAQRARREIVDALARAGLEPDDLFSTEMIFSELVANVVRHAGRDVELTLDLTQDAPVLHVIDAGDGFSVNPKLPMDRYAEHGRGLFIVMSLAREFSATPRTMRPGTHARVVLFGHADARGVATLPASRPHQPAER